MNEYRLPPSRDLPDASELIRRLEEIDSDLARVQRELPETAEEIHDKERDFQLAQSTTRLEQTGTVQEREDKTVKALWRSDSYVALVKARGKREGLKSVERVLTTRASIAQSELRTQKEEANR